MLDTVGKKKKKKANVMEKDRRVNKIKLRGCGKKTDDLLAVVSGCEDLKLS